MLVIADMKGYDLTVLETMIGLVVILLISIFRSMQAKVHIIKKIYCFAIRKYRDKL